MGRDIVQLETVVSTISQEYLLEFTSEYGISEDLHPELPSPEERIVDFLEGKYRHSLRGIGVLSRHLILWSTYAPVHNGRKYPLIHPEESVVPVFQ
nr:hypothetical protein [Tanacetum cinerariifolium]